MLSGSRIQDPLILFQLQKKLAWPLSLSTIKWGVHSTVVALNRWSTGQMINPAPGAWFKAKFMMLAQVVHGPIKPYCAGLWPKTPKFILQSSLPQYLDKTGTLLHPSVKAQGYWWVLGNWEGKRECQESVGLTRFMEWFWSWSENAVKSRSCVKALGKLWIHTASIHPAVMGTRWNES